MSLLPIDVQAFRRPPRCGLSAELFRRWPSGARMLLKSASIWLASVRVAKLGLIARILACGGFARERKRMFDRCGRLLASRASLESFGVAWHGGQAQTKTTNPCCAIPVGDRRGGSDHLRLFLGWLWHREDGLCLSNFDRLGFAAGNL